MILIFKEKWIKKEKEIFGVFDGRGRKKIEIGKEGL